MIEFVPRCPAKPGTCCWHRVYNMPVGTAIEYAQTEKCCYCGQYRVVQHGSQMPPPPVIISHIGG